MHDHEHMFTVLNKKIRHSIRTFNKKRSAEWEKNLWGIADGQRTRPKMGEF